MCRQIQPLLFNVNNKEGKTYKFFLMFQLTFNPQNRAVTNPNIQFCNFPTKLTLQNQTIPNKIKYQKLYVPLFHSKPVYVRIFEGGCHGGSWWLRGRLKSGSTVEIEAQLCQHAKMALQNR